jgi:hypothetical protein
MNTTCLVTEGTPDSCRACLQGLSEILSFEYAQYLVEDPDSWDYRVVASILPEGETGYDTAHRTGVIGQVFRTQKPVIVPDARNHPLYDSFDSRVEWELCFPLLAEGKLEAVINLEGGGSLDVDLNTWRRIGEYILKATQRLIIPSLPEADDVWQVPTTQVVVRSNAGDSKCESVLALARALARDGQYTLLVGDYPALLRGRSPTLNEIKDCGLSVSCCCFGVEPRLDLLAAGPRSEKSLLTRTDWWHYCDGRYSFVVLEADCLNTNTSSRTLFNVS